MERAWEDIRDMGLGSEMDARGVILGCEEGLREEKTQIRRKGHWGWVSRWVMRSLEMVF